MSSSPKFAIPQEVADIAISYAEKMCWDHPNVSKGIQSMESEIKRLRSEIVRMMVNR